MSSEVVISARNLTKFYGKARGIEDISFDAQKGEIFGFLGPNGAGKTTTIRILLDLLRPSSGEIEIFGQSVQKYSYDIRKQIGYLPVEFSAYANLSGFDFFGLIAKIRKVPLPENHELFRRFELSAGDLSKKIKALSHGTLQKIGIIQALFHQPRLLILDEPTTGLDPLMKEVFYDILREKHESGTTIFFSSHNLDEVEKLCSRVAIIRNGRIAGLERLENMRSKAGQIVEFTLKENAEIDDFTEGELLSKLDSHYIFRVQGDITQVLKKLAEMQVSNVSISKPDLESLFMEFYQDQSERGDVIS